MAFTRQETFNIVARHLLTQNAKSYDVIVGGVCMYRDSNGLKCAAGCLIPDDRYDPSFEGCTIAKFEFDARRQKGALIEIFPVGRLMVKLGHDLRLVRALQDVHDSFSEKDWPDALRKAASEFGLNTSVVNEFAPA